MSSVPSTGLCARGTTRVPDVPLFERSETGAGVGGGMSGVISLNPRLEAS